MSDHNHADGSAWLGTIDNTEDRKPQFRVQQMLDDLAEHVERPEERINELSKTDQDHFVEDVKKTTEYLKDTINHTKE